MTKIRKPGSAEVEGKIAALAEKIAAYRRERENPGGKIPQELREQVLSVLRESALPTETLARRIGVAGGSITNWTRKQPKSKLHSRDSTPRKERPPKKKGGFRPIDIVSDPTPSSSQANSARTFELELSSGARVRGLGMRDLMELIRTQGGA